MGCQYENNASFKLQCNEQQHIYIVNAILGRSAWSCRHNTCCPVNARCTKPASRNRMQQLRDTCDGEQHCQVTVVEGRCYSSYWTDTHYEVVKYLCINNTAGKNTCDRESEDIRESDSEWLLMPVRTTFLEPGNCAVATTLITFLYIYQD